MKQFVEQNLDLLQNLEFAITQIYREDPVLIDYGAKDAVDAAARHYHAEESGRTPPERNLAERGERVFQAIHAVCEFRLGRLGEEASSVSVGQGCASAAGDSEVDSAVDAERRPEGLPRLREPVRGVSSLADRVVP